MLSIVGKVKSVNGLFNVKSSDGSERKVIVGENVYEQEMIAGEQKNSPKDSLVLLLNDGSELVVLGNTKQLLDSSLLSEAFTKEETVTQKDSFLALLEANNNIENVEDLETAAGETVVTQSTESPEAVFLATNYTLSNINTDLYERSFQDDLSDFGIDINEDIRRTDANDTLSITVTPIATLTEESVTAGTTVATSVASDEDGGAITFTIDDTTNYAIDSATGEVTLTTQGAAIVNGGADLPNFTVTATSSNSTANQEVNPANTTTSNDPLNLTVTPIATLTEESVTAGTTVATSVASDEDGGAITFTIDDTTNYAIDSATGEVTLTTQGAAIVNGGADLPNFTVTATSSNSNASQEVNPANTTDVNDTASVLITGEATQGQTLSATVSDADGVPSSVTYEWKAGNTVVQTSTSNTLTLTEAMVGQTISVTANYTDNHGTAESPTDSIDTTNNTTDTVQNVNDTASVLITGEATQGQTLSATVSDADGVPSSVTYEWKAGNTVVQTSTSNTLTLTEAMVGQTISVTANYTDNHGTAESPTDSIDTTNNTTDTVQNVNDTASVLITGEATQGQTLSATVSDADGVPSSVTYEWKAGNTVVQTSTSNTLTLTEAMVGQTISVTANYTDNHGTAESPTDSIDTTNNTTDTVQNVNDTASVLITGEATQGQTLSATVSDADGVPSSVTYEWKAGNTVVQTSTSNTLTLTEAMVGQTISVTANYTDNHGTAESPTDSIDTTNNTTDTVQNVNDTASVLITGEATQGQTLSATVSDADGVPSSVTYEWKAGNTVVQTSTSNTLTLTEAMVGQTISVTANYTDNHGTAESPTDSIDTTNNTTDTVQNVNDIPVAYANNDAVSLNATTIGNVITDEYQGKIDTAGDGITTLSGVTYDGVVYNSFDSNGNLAINAKYGDVTFNVNGDYTYKYTGPDSIVTGGTTVSQWSGVSFYAYQGEQLFGADDNYTESGQLALSTLEAHTSGVSENDRGIGVKDITTLFNPYNHSIDGNDALILKFDSNISQVALHLNDTSFMSMLSGVTVSAYNESGEKVYSSSKFNIFTFLGTADKGIDISPNVAFKYLVIESSGMNDHYYLDKISYTPAVDTYAVLKETFTYEITDADADQSSSDKSSADLTININGSLITVTQNSTDTASFVEDQESGVLAANGSLTNTLVDGSVGTFSTTVTSSGDALGSLVMSANGEWRYSVDNANLQFLAKDEVYIDTFIVSTTDGTDSHVIRINITGVNDAPDAKNDTIITNIAAGQNITISADILMMNDLDVDRSDILSVSNISNVVNGTVSGTDTITIKDTASFGTNAQSVNESDIFSGDSETSGLNNDMSHAYELLRSQFGKVSSVQASFITDASLPSFKWNGRIEDVQNSPDTTDKDFIKVYLYKDEKIILDIDGADSGKKNIGADDKAVDMHIQLYGAEGNLLASNDDALDSLGGDGSVKSAYHTNSLDSYLEYTVLQDGYYYIEATAWNNSKNNIKEDSGDYQLWISVQQPASTPHLLSFDYELTDAKESDSAQVSVLTVQGSTINGTDADEILIGGTGDDTLNSGAGDDILDGGAGVNTYDGGVGYDILIVEAAIDFSKVSNVEELNLGEGAQNIALALSDVLAMTDADNELFITGDSSDNVTLQGSAWIESSTQSKVGFDEYISSSQDATVKLQIQEDLTVSHS